MKRGLLLHFVRQDLIDRHASSALGALWTLLLPLANILIFTLVFSQIMGARLQAMGMDYLGKYSYSTYLIFGLLAWNCFSSTLTRTSQIFHEKSALITKVNISLFSLPLYVLISETIIYAISMSFFLVFLWLVDFNWHAGWVWLPLIFAIQQLLAYSLGLILAILSVFFRDIKEIVFIVVQFWFWLTPIVYVITILPPKWAVLLQWNPIYHTTKAYRDSMIAGHTPELGNLCIVLFAAALLLLAGLFIGRHLEKDIRDFL